MLQGQAPRLTLHQSLTRLWTRPLVSSSQGRRRAVSTSVPWCDVAVEGKWAKGTLVPLYRFS